MGKKLEYQYYNSHVECESKTAFHKDCKCWHDEGTGPYENLKHDGVEGDFLAWRIKSKKHLRRNN